MIWALLLAFQVKHFLCDYPLQTKYMLGKFKPGWDFLGPLFTHCAVHAYVTFIVASVYLIYNDKLTGHQLLPLDLFCLDFALHFVMDRLKAGPKYLGRFKAMSGAEYSRNEKMMQERTMRDMAIKAERGNRFFWYSLGIDQLVHHLTHYAIIYLLLEV